ncbi:HD domain-containing protein [Chloroflexi bacterium TSY]|nr:HD domain-containing protein [Chloroflexi bacterium TSY]
MLSTYRIKQFLWGLRAKVELHELEFVRQTIPEGAWSLFQRMPVDAQRHSLNVLYTLRDTYSAHPDLYNDPDLIVAALLHDVGKIAADDAGVRIGLWLRGPLVLFEAFMPRQMQQLASPNPKDGWRHALYVYLEHPRIGAAWATEVGCSSRACRLIGQHQNKNVQFRDKRDLELLQALQLADSQN